MHFKKFLKEGGAATQELGTQRATKSDVEFLIPVISELTGISTEDVKNQFVGSTSLLLMDKVEDTGDIDFIVTAESQADKDALISKFTERFGPGKKIGQSIFSFAAPTQDKKVQFDLMFVQSINWAKFAYYADPDSKYKSGVRNELIHAILKNNLKSGEDIIINDEEGNLIARASKSFMLNSGVKRIFKKAMQKEDGSGYTKALAHATPDEIQQLLDEYGITKQFSPHADETAKPEVFVTELFGDGTSVEDLSSAEKIIQLVKDKMPNKANKIFSDAARGMEKRKFDIPEEMKKPA